jgi:phosphonate transport system substrate-binding protein
MDRMRKIFLIIACLNLLQAPLSAQEQTYSFGIVPQQAASQLAKVWIPILQYLEQQSGVRLQFQTAKDIPTFEERVFAQEYDFAYMNPYHYVVFSQKPGYRAIAKERNKSIMGLIVVRKDSSTTGLAQLNGARIAFPSPGAFAASVLPRANLQQEGIQFTPQYVSSHDSVYIAVTKGLFPAGGGIVRTLRNMPQEIQDQLQVLWETRKFTPHAIAARPGLAPEVAEQVQQAMLAMSSAPEGAELLQAIGFRQGLEAAEDAQWDDVRALNITLLDKYLK